MKNQVPPHDLELEKAVLGGALLDSSILLDVMDNLSSDCFYDPDHKIVFEKGVQRLFAKGQPIDILTVTQELNAQNLLKGKLNAYYISTLTSRIASVLHLDSYIRYLRGFATKRQLIRIGAQVVQKGYSNDVDGIELLDQTTSQLDQLGIKLSPSQIDPFATVMQQSLERIELAVNSTDEVTGITSGFYDLDRITNGWQKSDFILLASRPSMGKTALATNYASNAAIDFGHDVAIFELEMSKVQLGMRILSSVSGIALERIIQGNLNSLELSAIRTASEKIKGAGIHIDDTAGLTIMELRARAKRLKHQFPNLGLIIIDYLQLLTDNSRKYGNREQEISAISRQLKILAKELDIPIIALSQLSRAVETRGGDKKPQLSDLRESGSLEQDADIVMFLYRPEYYGITEDAEGNDIRNQGAIIIAKHRNGKLATIKVGFKGEFSKFMSLSDLLKF